MQKTETTKGPTKNAEPIGGSFWFVPASDVKVDGDMWNCPSGRWHHTYQSCLCKALKRTA